MKVTITPTARRSGPFSRKISVTTNDAEHHKTFLTCAGTVLVPFQMKPSTISFGQLARRAGPQKKTATITRGDGGPLRLELSPTSDPNVQASLREVEPGERYELDVEVTPGWSKGSWRTNLVLKTGIPEAPEEKILVYGHIIPRLRAIPARFAVPRDLPAERELRARLVWSNNQPGQILEVTSNDPDLPVRIEERNGQQLVVVLVPAGYTPPLRPPAAVTLKTDDAEAPTLEIQLRSAPVRRSARTTTRPSGAAARPFIRPGLRRPTTRPAVWPGLRQPTSQPAVRPGIRRPTSRPVARPTPAKPED